MTKLSVIIITLNEEARIRPTLESALPVAAEIVVVDSYSSDRTADICRECGCRVLQRKFEGYGPQKQFAVEQAANDWIMYLDADEVLTPELQQELAGLFECHVSSADERKNKAVDLERISGLWVRSQLFYMGKILRHSGVGKEFHLRLFDRRKGGFTSKPVHEGIEVTGDTGRLSATVIHYSYTGITHHLGKINTYSTLAAQEYIARGKSFSKFWVPGKFIATFFSFYFIRRGFLDGYPGFMWSFQAAVYTAVKVAKTIELSSQK